VPPLPLRPKLPCGRCRPPPQRPVCAPTPWRCAWPGSPTAGTRRTRRPRPRARPACAGCRPGARRPRPRRPESRVRPLNLALFAYSVPVHWYTLAASSSLSWPLVFRQFARSVLVCPYTPAAFFSLSQPLVWASTRVDLDSILHGLSPSSAFSIPTIHIVPSTTLLPASSPSTHTLTRTLIITDR